MVKKNINITNAYGQTETKICYFNLTRMEMFDLLKKYKEGYEEHVQNIIDSKDNNSIMNLFTELILASYCKVNEDGTIIKNKELTEAFIHSEEYSELMFDLLNTEDQTKAQEFITAIMPKQMQQQMQAEIKKNQTTNVVNIETNK
jgi:hypothetical protein